MFPIYTMGSGACAGGGNPVQIQDPLRVVRKEDSRFPRSYFSFRGKQKDSSIYPAIINHIYESHTLPGNSSNSAFQSTQGKPVE